MLVPQLSSWVNCTRCPLSNGRTYSPVVGEETGQTFPTIVVIRDHPTKTEIFSKSKGDTLLNKYLTYFKETYQVSFFVTSVLSCIPVDPTGSIRKPTVSEVNACLPRLATTLDELDPLVVLLLGSLCLNYWVPDKGSIREIATDPIIPQLRLVTPGKQHPIDRVAFATWSMEHLEKNEMKDPYVSQSIGAWEKAIQFSKILEKHYHVSSYSKKN